MGKFWFWLTNTSQKLTNIRVTYSLITTSGEEILEIGEKVKPIKTLVVKYKKFGDYWRYEDILKKDKDYLKIFDKRAEEILNDSQKKERKHLKNGWLDSGNYIVKCVWEIYLDFEDVTFEEVNNV